MATRPHKFSHQKDTKLDYRTVVGVQDSEDTDELILTDSATVTWDTSQKGKAIATATGGGGSSTTVSEGTGIDVATSGSNNTVSLDIHSLTSTTVASGDEVPIQDVSVGNATADQRRTTAGAIAALSNGALLDHVHNTDTTASAVTKGDLIYGNSTPEWDDLPIGSEGQILAVVSGVPAWTNFSPQTPRRNCGTNVGTSSNHMVMTGCPFQNGSFTMTSAGNNPARTLTDYMFSQVATTSVSGNQAYWESRSTNLGPSFRHRMTMRAIISVIDSAGTDNVKYRAFAGLYETQAGSGPPGLTTCQSGATWNGGGSWDATFLCWEKSVQANIMVCGGETSSTTIHCTDTGIAAPASDTKIDLFLDHRDGSKITGAIDGVAFANDETTKLPATSSNSQIATMVGITNSAVPSGANAIVIKAYAFEYTWQ